MFEKFKASATLILLVLPFILMSCVPIENKYGVGKINLSSAVLDGFAKYKELQDPSYFAVSEDGQRYGYSYCKKPPCSTDWEYTQNIAIYSCEKNSYGSPCRIYASGTTIVWRQY